MKYRIADKLHWALKALHSELHFCLEWTGNGNDWDIVIDAADESTIIEVLGMKRIRELVPLGSRRRLARWRHCLIYWCSRRFPQPGVRELAWQPRRDEDVEQWRRNYLRTDRPLPAGWRWYPPKGDLG